MVKPAVFVRVLNKTDTRSSDVGPRPGPGIGVHLAVSVGISSVRVFNGEELFLFPFVLVLERLFVDDVYGQDGHDDGDNQESDAPGQASHSRRRKDDAALRLRGSHRRRDVTDDAGWRTKSVETRKRHATEFVPPAGT